MNPTTVELLVLRSLSPPAPSSVVHVLTKKPALLFKGESSLMCALLLPPILEGVIGMLARGDTREKERTIRSFGWAFRTPIRTGKGQ